MSYLLSVILYLFLGCIVSISSYNAEKSKSPMGRFCWCFVIVFSLSFFPGLRAVSVGIDTSIYAPRFESILAGGDAQLLFGWGYGFSYIINMWLQLTDNVQSIFILFSVLTNSLIIFRLYEMRNMISFPYSIFVYYGIYYFYTYNIFKQMLAVAIVFFALRYISNKKYIRFIVLLLLAAQIHLSALLGISYIGINILAWKKINTKRLMLVFLLFIGTPVVISIVYSTGQEKLLYYFQAVKADLGFLIIFKSLLLLMSLNLNIKINLNRSKSKNKESNQLDAIIEGIDSRRGITITYIVGLSMTTLGYFYPYMDRMGLYHMIYEIVFWGMQYKKEKRSVFVIAFTMVAIIMFLMTVIRSEQGQTPYVFFFQ